jgi:hypothetical protein
VRLAVAHDERGRERRAWALAGRECVRVAFDQVELLEARAERETQARHDR